MKLNADYYAVPNEKMDQWYGMLNTTDLDTHPSILGAAKQYLAVVSQPEYVLTSNRKVSSSVDGGGNKRKRQPPHEVVDKQPVKDKQPVNPKKKKTTRAK